MKNYITQISRRLHREVFNKKGQLTFEKISYGSFYYNNEKCHREDGPAKIWIDDHVEYWLNDTFYYKTKFYYVLYSKEYISIEI
jgi:hypothetical protein